MKYKNIMKVLLEKNLNWPDNIYILGAKNLARETHCYLQDVLEELELKIPNIYYIDTILKEDSFLNGIKVLCKFPRDKKGQFIVAVSVPWIKELLASQAHKAGMTPFIPLIHRDAYMGDYFTSIGGGSVISAHCTFTTNITLGNFVYINYNTSVGHDTIIGDYSTINPGGNIAGNVLIDHHVEIGTGVTIINKIHVAPYNYIAAGAVLTKSFEEENTLIAGVPAIVKRHNYNEKY